MGIAQELATQRDLQELGVYSDTFAALPDRQKRSAIRFASAWVTSYLRPREPIPWPVFVEDFTVTSAAGSATQTTPPPGSPSAVADVVLTIVVGGAVSSGVCTYQVSLDAGVTQGPVVALPSTGLVVLDGVSTTLAGAWAAGDALSYACGCDYVMRGHVCGIASWVLLHNRGVDPKTEAELQARYDAALKWMEAAMGPSNIPQIPTHVDAPELPSLDGPLFHGQNSPYAWLDDDRQRGR